MIVRSFKNITISFNGKLLEDELQFKNHSYVIFESD